MQMIQFTPRGHHMLVHLTDPSETQAVVKQSVYLLTQDVATIHIIVDKEIFSDLESWQEAFTKAYSGKQDVTFAITKPVDQLLAKAVTLIATLQKQGAPL